jgi:hypothetical protein
MEKLFYAAAVEEKKNQNGNMFTEKQTITIMKIVYTIFLVFYR